ncbi:MAG TPA: ABC transporter substrate-binding protein, partial [Ornithinibacter sp.]|nr:ABC transporter substrate-binding protein [Ornithinibacter sp.]
MLPERHNPQQVPTAKENNMRHRRLLALPAVAMLLLAACGGDDGDDEEGGDTGAGQSENTGEVNLLSAGEPEEVDAYQEIFDDLINSETDYTVEIESAGNFEEQFQIRAEGGTLDVAAVPQPGAIPALVDSDSIVSLEDMGFDIQELNDLLGESFMALGEYQGKHYGLPTNINLKSMVWYPKDDFDAAGYQVPETWDELVALSDQIKADGSTPWCVGFGSEGSTGWPATDWMEDIMLRTAGPDVYDQWVKHEIPFNDPAVAT